MKKKAAMAALAAAAAAMKMTTTKRLPFPFRPSPCRGQRCGPSRRRLPRTRCCCCCCCCSSSCSSSCSIRKTCLSLFLPLSAPALARGLFLQTAPPGRARTSRASPRSRRPPSPEARERASARARKKRRRRRLLVLPLAVLVLVPLLLLLLLLQREPTPRARRSGLPMPALPLWQSALPPTGRTSACAAKWPSAVWAETRKGTSKGRKKEKEKKKNKEKKKKKKKKRRRQRQAAAAAAAAAAVVVPPPPPPPEQHWPPRPDRPRPPRRASRGGAAPTASPRRAPRPHGTSRGQPFCCIRCRFCPPPSSPLPGGARGAPRR